MQREKVYNLHKIGYFIVALFVFKIDKISLQLRRCSNGLEEFELLKLFIRIERMMQENIASFEVIH
jgi:hypothetical protein